MRISRYFYIFSLFLFLLILSCEQERGPRFSVEEQVSDLKEELALTDDQADQITDILKEQRNQMENLRESFDGERGQMRDKFREIREKTNTQIKELLTDEQKEKYDEFVEERQSRMRRPRPGNE